MANEAWVIRNKNTGEFFRAPSGKSSWKAKSYAKSAWSTLGSGNSYCGDSRWLDEKLTKYSVNKIIAKRNYSNEEYETFPYFDEQGTWEMVDLNKSVQYTASQLKEATELLTTVVEEERVSGRLEELIKQFLEGVK